MNVSSSPLQPFWLGARRARRILLRTGFCLKSCGDSFFENDGVCDPGGLWKGEQQVHCKNRPLRKKSRNLTPLGDCL